MAKAQTGAWRAFSTSVQADIATAKTAYTLFNFEGEPIEPEPDNYYTNTEEITGELLPTTKRLVSMKLNGKHKSKAFPHLVGMFAAQAMGKDTVTTVGATTAKQHLLEIDKTVVELPYRTMLENDGSLQYQYVGIACTGFKLSGSRGGFVEFEADLTGSGKEAADVTAKPSRVAESYMTFGDLTINKGGTYAAGAVTGGTSWNARLVDFELEYKNNGKGVHLAGDSTGYMGAIRRGKTYSISLSANIEIDDASLRTDLLAGNEFVMDIPIVGGVANGSANYTIETILPRVAFAEAKKGYNDGILKVGGKFHVLSDPTNGPIFMKLINMYTPNYLATT